MNKLIICKDLLYDSVLIEKEIISLDIDSLLEHIKKCKYCKDSIKEYYDNLDMPFYIKSLINSQMEKLQ